MNKAEEIKALDKKYVMHTYGRFDVVLDHGKGATCWDLLGKKYIDFGAGIGVASLGHGHEKWVKAVSEQAAKLAHCSNLYYTEPYVRVAQKLCEASGMDRMIFCNSGAEANEISIKLARKHSFDKYGKNRGDIITIQNSFHGRTITTLAATGQEVFHNYFFPFTEGFSYAAGNDLESVKKLITEKTCGILLETIQGEGGVLELDEAFIKGVEQLCREHDLSFMLDEVQTGIGRTGELFSFTYFDVHPDIVSVAKGIGNGLPLGGVLTAPSHSEVFGPGDHGTTFGANPIACAGAEVVLDTILAPGFLDSIKKRGDYMREKIAAFPQVTSVRGKGLMIGLSLDRIEGKTAAAKCLENGLLVLTAKSAVRLLPPLTITMDEIDEGLAILKESIAQSAASK